MESPTNDAAAKDCKHDDSCNAPICPLDEKSTSKCIWYPDEEICHSRKFASMMFIQKQRLVAKREGEETKYFTFEMLNRNIVVKQGIIGIDPDQEIESANRAERKWISDHPERKPLSRDVRMERHKQVTRMNQARSVNMARSSRTTHIAA